MNCRGVYTHISWNNQREDHDMGVIARSCFLSDNTSRDGEKESGAVFQAKI